MVSLKLCLCVPHELRLWRTRIRLLDASSLTGGRHGPVCLPRGLSTLRRRLARPRSSRPVPARTVGLPVRGQSDLLHTLWPRGAWQRAASLEGRFPQRRIAQASKASERTCECDCMLPHFYE